MARLIPPGWKWPDDPTADPEREVGPDPNRQSFHREYVQGLVEFDSIIIKTIKIDGKPHSLIVPEVDAAWSAKKTPNLRASILCGYLIFGAALLCGPNDKLERS